MDASRIRKAGELVERLMGSKAADEAQGWARFFSSWNSSVGERLAAHSKPVDVRNGIVLVEAEHPGWIQLLQLKQEGLLAQLKKAFPELGIRGIAFRLQGSGGREIVPLPDAKPDALGPGARSAAAGTASAGTVVPDPAEAAAIQGSLAEVQDEAFKALLAGVAESLLKRK
jgi:hypothetical protein